ncbi:dTDP-4-dehydrorhamnose reductase [Pelagibius sp. 7325]|uniref:dTDP-4-dehydrorhamnose reductase n=1 Tax=Pelagibius sp. 7325 TaxID=3131994 RepID=UPI0030EC0F07
MGPLLLLGADGQLGHEVRVLAAARALDLVALNRRQLDITAASEVRAAITGRFAAVINAAAYTAVDKAERDAAAAFAVNRDGANHVAEACAAAGVRLIHISTDYVFDGAKGAPYVEDDAVRPLNVYGASKEAGEAVVRAACADHVILRTAWVFGAAGSNFVKTMLRLSGERDGLSIVADQFGCPTPAAALAARAIAAAGDEARGTYHCAGEEPTSWHGFAQAIFAAQREITGRPRPKLAAIATADYPTPARRPADSTLDSGLFQATFGEAAIDWRAGLTAVLETLAALPDEEGDL